SAASPESCSPHEAHKLMPGGKCEVHATPAARPIACSHRPGDVECGGSGTPIAEGDCMRAWSWLVFFVVCNIVGVEVFKAAMTLPLEDALVPRLLCVPLIGLTAFG